MSRYLRGASYAALVITIVGASIVTAAPPTAADMMAFQPKQQGVLITVPTGAELAGCKVELVSGPGQASGWAMKDARGQFVRKFVASKGAKASIDMWCYYLDGNEVYREIDTNDDKKADQFRWYGMGGMRWGVDLNGDGKIDGWKMISAEEVSQEVLKAAITGDVARFQALLINDAEIKALELPVAEAQRIAQSVAQAGGKFQQMAKALNLNDKAQWLQFGGQPPQCVPAEQIGSKIDLFHYKGATLLYQQGEKTDGMNLGQMIQVGRAWRLVGAPTPGQGDPNVVGGPQVDAPVNIPQPLITKLQDVDKNAPKPGDSGPSLVRYNLQRAAVLEEIANAVQGKDKEQWVKQIADCLSTAVQNSPAGDRAAQIRLSAIRELFEKQQPGSPLTGYVVFRDMSSKYSVELQEAKGEKLAKVQDAWRDSLKDFVQKYATAEDAPDAALNIGMVSEFMGKESDAKEWYGKLAQNYAQHPYAKKAQGALRRIGLEGQPFTLEGPTIDGRAFNIAQAQGKTVVVYYWASWSNQSANDFKRLAELNKTYADKGMYLVTVNLDDNVDAAKQALNGAQLPAITLHTPGGLESPLAVQYGIMVLPNIFVVDKTGKCTSRTAQMSNLEDEVKKAMDK